MNGLLSVFHDKLRRIFLLRPVFTVLVGAMLLYAVFYPQPYLTEALREVPLIAVDKDGTSSDRLPLSGPVGKLVQDWSMHQL